MCSLVTFSRPNQWSREWRIVRTIHVNFLHLCICFMFILLATTTAGQQLRPPRIKEHPTSVIVKKHEPAKLECKADGNPPPKIEWYKDNEKVHPTANRMVLDNQIIFLHVIAKKGDQGDTGTYYCLARNEVGKVKSLNATLEVALLREEFRLMPENVRAAVGETAIFQCNPPRGHPEPIVSWTHKGQPVNTNNGRFKMDGPNLVINGVTQHDHGQYRCVAKNLYGTRESPPAILKVLVKPYFIRAPEDVTAMSGEDIVFHCKVGGDPSPTITWKREDGKMLNARSQILEDKALRITHVRSSEEGVYICEVENIAGQLSSAATLAVHSLPNFVTTPKNVQVAAGAVAKMECLVSGSPQPIYFWSKEGTQVLMFPGDVHGKLSVSNDGILSIANAEKEDQGYYICSAVSRVGSTIARAHLSVLMLNDVSPPIIRLGSANQTLPQNTKAFLPCEAATGPSPVTIKWYINKVPIYNDTHFMVTSKSLQIQNIQTSDSGLYTCVASSVNGETEWNARLHVESPHNPNIIFYKMPDPSQFPEPPSRPEMVNATETSITVAWRRPGSSGASHHIGSMLEYYSPDMKNGWTEVARRIQSDVVTVRNLRPNTRYMFVVRAENKHGIGYPSPISDEMQTISSSSMSDIDMKQIRNQLNDVHVKLRDLRTISSVSVKLVWTVMGNVDLIDGYYIRYQHVRNKLINSKFNMVTVFDGASSSYTITELKKAAKYQFFIVPYYKNIEGKPSNSLMVKTYEDVPSSPPLNIRVKAINSSCALLEWFPPAEESQNGQIKGYHLQIYENETYLYANLTLDASYSSIVLYNLSLSSLYTIRALAYTTIGNGPFSQPIYLNMESALRNTLETINDGYPTSTYQGIAYPLTSIWFYVFILSIIAILALLLFGLVKIMFIYNRRKGNKTTYEKANQHYNENFPKYNSGSSKCSSSFPDNEYAEVNDLKNYGENQEKVTLVPYAMTPLVENTSSTNSSRTSYCHSNRNAFASANENDLATESLLNDRNKINYGNGGSFMGNVARANYLQAQRRNQMYDAEQHGNIPSPIQMGNLPSRGNSQTTNEYESATEALAEKHNSSLEYDGNLSDFDKNSITNDYRRSQRGVPCAKYSIHPEPGKSFLPDNKLSTFGSNTPLQTRITMNPIDSAFESNSLNHRGNEINFTNQEVNHYLVSDELSNRYTTNNYNTDIRYKARPEFPYRYNMSLSSNEFPSSALNNPFAHNVGRRNELSIHDKFVKSKVQSKKRNGHHRPSMDLNEPEHR